MTLVHEEKRIIQYLQSHPICTFRQLLRACLPESPSSWAQQILANLEWLGYVNVFLAQNGEPSMLQITSRGKNLRSV